MRVVVSCHYGETGIPSLVPWGTLMCDVMTYKPGVPGTTSSTASLILVERLLLTTVRRILRSDPTVFRMLDLATFVGGLKCYNTVYRCMMYGTKSYVRVCRGIRRGFGKKALPLCSSQQTSCGTYPSNGDKSRRCHPQNGSSSRTALALESEGQRLWQKG
jgi:hypothetical protein